MARYIWLLVLSVLPLAASAQRTPPDNLKVCFSDGDCVSMMMVSDSYIGWTGPKMDTEWRFTVDAWTMEKMRLSGRATLQEPRASGRAWPQPAHHVPRWRRSRPATTFSQGNSRRFLLKASRALVKVFSSAR